MGYPTSVFSPTTKNTGDVVQASHVNDLQTEVVAIETAALSGSWTVPNQPRLSAAASTTQSISSSQSTGVRLQFPSVSYDVGGGWSTTTFAYTTPSSGAYLINVSVLFAAGDPAGRLDVYVNNTLEAVQYVSTLFVQQRLTHIANVNASASIHVGVLMDSTVARQTGVTNVNYTTLSIVKLC